MYWAHYVRLFPAQKSFLVKFQDCALQTRIPKYFLCTHPDQLCSMCPTALSLVGGGEGGVAAELFTSPEAVSDGQRDEFGLGEWQDTSGLTSRNAAYQEQQAVENNLQRL